MEKTAMVRRIGDNPMVIAMFRPLSVVCAALLVALPVSAQQIYKWTDAQGQVHYTTEPPPGGAKPQKSLAVPPSLAPAASGNGKASAPKSFAEKELEFRQRRIAAEEARAKQAQEQAAQKDKQQNCQQAQAQLRALQSGARVAKFNEKGERVYLEDSQREQEIQAAQKAADSWCK